MLIESANERHQPNWGLIIDDLEKIIEIEKLKDRTNDFHSQIQKIIDKFGHKADMRIIEFNEKSGEDIRSKQFFSQLIEGRRYLFYSPILSNKENCVILASSSSGINRMFTNQHLLCHEYAHHIEIAHAGFPFYIPKHEPASWVPPFATPYEIGSEDSYAYLDNRLMRDCKGDMIIMDASERISDIIVEGLLRSHDLHHEYIKTYDRATSIRDPTSSIVSVTINKYIRRLTIRDFAEITSCLQLAYPDNKYVEKISKGLRHIIFLNKKYLSSSKIRNMYNSILQECINTDYNLFKKPNKWIEYTKYVLKTLQIKISRW